MANGKTNVDVFARAGRAAAGGGGSYIDYAKIGAEIDAAAKKTAELLKNNPNGVEIPKITDPVSEKVSSWLSSKKDEITKMENLARNGTAKQKKEAVEYLNNIDQGVRKLDDDFNKAALAQAKYLDMEKKGTYASSNTSEQTRNFHKFANGDFAKEGEIIEDENGMPRLAYDGKIWDTIDVGNEYNFKLEDGIDKILGEIEDLGINKKAWNRNKTRRELEAMTRNPKAIKDYMYQNKELIDAYISKQTGIPQTIDGKENPKWRDFKAGIGNKMPRIGDVGPQEERKLMYDDYFNANKIDVNFGNDFVDLVMETYQRAYDNPPKSSDIVKTVDDYLNE